MNRLPDRLNPPLKGLIAGKVEHRVLEFLHSLSELRTFAKETYS